MAVKDRTKPIQAVVTKSPAKYLGPQTLLGLTRHLVQVLCEGVLITAWLTDEDFEKGFENVPELKPRTDPSKPIRLRRDAWDKTAAIVADKVHCIWSVDVNGTVNHFVRIDWKDGTCRAEYWKDEAFQAAFENVPDESPVASVTVDGERLSGVKSVDIECDNGAAPEPHEGNGKAKAEIDWEGEVECRSITTGGPPGPWRPFEVRHKCSELTDRVYGKTPTHEQLLIYPFEHWEFRNKPQPKPDPKWEAAMDGRPVDCHRKTLWQVWVQCPGVPVPIVVHTGTSRIGALGILTDMRDDAIMPKGTRFAIQACKAPVMPEAVEVGA